MSRAVRLWPAFGAFVRFQFEAGQRRHHEEITVKVAHRFSDERELEIAIIGEGV